MRRPCLLIAGALFAAALGGCGESSEEGPVSYKGTDSPAIRKQLENMSANVKSGAVTTKTAETPAPKKDAEKKPSGDPVAEKK